MSQSSSLRLTVMGWLAVLLSTVVLFSVLDGSEWFVQCLGAMTIVAVLGAGGRALRVPGPITMLAQVAVGFCYMTALYASEFAAGGFVPDRDAIEALQRLTDEGFFQIETLTPPVVPGEGISLVTVAAVLLAAILVDLLAAAYGQTALAGLPLLALYVVPAALLPEGVDAWLFVLPALGYLLMLLADSRDRLLGWGIPIGGRVAEGQPGRGGAQLSRMSRNVGVAALSLSVAVPAAMPRLTDGAFGQKGIGDSQGKTISTLDPLVTMRRNLQNRTDVELMRVRTSSARPGELYLRAVTLDEFNGTEWKAARREVRKFDGALPEAPGLGRGVDTTPVDTQVFAGENLQSDYLPMPYPATQLDIEGKWRLDEKTGNVVSYEGREQITGKQYAIASYDLTPTAEDMAGALGPLTEYLEPYLQLPDIPAAVVNEAKRITRGADGPLEIGVALQQFFRRPGNFVYDLSVTGGTGNSALLDFLRDRRGYCEHFATAMAVMARIAGVPSRINVGFTSGELADDGIERVISSDDAHAWPELWMPGVGWTRFEPTPGSANSNPSAPSFLPGGDTEDEPDPGREDEVEPSPEPEPSEEPGGGSSEGGSAGSEGAAGGAEDPPPPPDCTEEQSYDPETNTCNDKGIAWYVRWKWQLLTAGLLLLLAAPRLLRLAIRRRRWVNAGRGDAVLAAEIAWRELRDDTLDLGYLWPPARTPRQTAADLQAGGTLSAAGVAEMTLVAGTLERSRYAKPGSSVDHRRLRSAVLNVRRDQAGRTGRLARLRALILPPSLVPWLRETTSGTFAPGFARRAATRAGRIARTRSFKTS
ncbi:MAG: transglutaminase family protein [Sporichthyaceae bacterium]